MLPNYEVQVIKAEHSGREAKYLKDKLLKPKKIVYENINNIPTRRRKEKKTGIPKKRKTTKSGKADSKPKRLKTKK